MEEQPNVTSTFLAMKEGVEVSEEVMQRVLPCMAEMKRRMREIPPDELNGYVGCIVMMPLAGGLVRVLPKADVLQAVLEMAAGLGRDEPPPANIIRSLETPVVGGMRVLVLTDDGYIALRVMTDDGASEFEANDRERLGYTYKALQPTRVVPDTDSESMSVGLRTVSEDISKLLKPYSKETQRKVLQDVSFFLRSPSFQELRRLEPDLVSIIQEFERRVKEVPAPACDTAGNLETLLMSAIHVWEPFTSKLEDVIATEDGRELLNNVTDEICGHWPHVAKFNHKCAPLFNIPGVYDFCKEWREANFARLEVGHKLAASLSLTDVPDDIEVLAPWPNWSLVVPDGLLGSIRFENDDKSPIARLLCKDAAMRFIVTANGRILGPFEPNAVAKATDTQALIDAIACLVRGCCLALSEPDDYSKKRMGNAGKSSKSKRSGPPELEQAKFMLSAPITIDLRPQLLDMLNGKTRASGGGGKLTTQFMVRGHWKQQVYGKGRALRKRIRIAPFWKGDENARILLRNYTIKDEEPETTP